MKDIRAKVMKNLTEDDTLLELVDKENIGERFKRKNFPCVTCYEWGNIPALVADGNIEYGSRVTFNIDVWGRDDVTDIVQAVDKAMKRLGFKRDYISPDLYEEQENVYHRNMQYTIKT